MRAINTALHGPLTSLLRYIKVAMTLLYFNLVSLLHDDHLDLTSHKLLLIPDKIH